MSVSGFVYEVKLASEHSVDEDLSFLFTEGVCLRLEFFLPKKFRGNGL